LGIGGGVDWGLAYLLLLVMTGGLCDTCQASEWGWGACDVAPLNRIDCGWNGITSTLCQNRIIGGANCCFNPAGNPQCYISNTSACALPIPDRLDFEGPNGHVSQEECESYGPDMCWDVRYKPFCYYSSTSQCFFNPEERQDCGWNGITRDVCLMKGCCFDSSKLAAWCYHGLTKNALSWTMTLAIYLLILTLPVLGYLVLTDHRKRPAFHSSELPSDWDQTREKTRVT